MFGKSTLVRADRMKALDSIGQRGMIRMFYNCTSLTTPPILPATTLNQGYEYSQLFSGCTALTTAAEMPATEYGAYTCEKMYYQCSSLVNIPDMTAAITMGSNSCNGMFVDCTSLTKPCKLSATTLGGSCYNGMFKGCTNIKWSSTGTPWRVPTEGTASGTTDDATTNMLQYNTFEGVTAHPTPTLNTTYYIKE